MKQKADTGDIKMILQFVLAIFTFEKVKCTH